MPNTSSAYDFEYFSPKRKEPEREAQRTERDARRAERKEQRMVELSEKELRRSHRRNANTARMLGALLVTLVVAGGAGAVVFGQVQLTELTEQIHTAEKALDEEKSLSVQLEMQAGANMNTDEIAEYARDHLGMEKATEGQTSYISLSQGDAGTVLQKDSIGGFFTGIWEAILSIFS